MEFQQRFLPQDGEWLIQKQVPDAFCASGLEARLREAGIGQLIIVGVATNNSVESTARSAGNLGFDTWVAEDACFTFDKADYFGTRVRLKRCTGCRWGICRGSMRRW